MTFTIDSILPRNDNIVAEVGTRVAEVVGIVLIGVILFIVVVLVVENIVVAVVVVAVVVVV